MVYVTHDQVEAMTLADRIVVMNAGRIEQVGTPLELYNRPANLFVAGFIGSPQMNFIDGGATRRWRRHDHRGPARAPDRQRRGAAHGRARLVHAEHLGADTILYLDTEKAGTITVRLFGEVGYPPDVDVYVSRVRPARHRFDEAGQVIS